MLETILYWLRRCPLLENEKLFLSYLPAYAGWSCTAAKQETRTDILGTARRSFTLTLTRRITVQNEDDRLALLNEADALADWCVMNPMPGTRVRRSGLPALTARSPSGTEDAEVSLILSEL